MIAPPRSRSVLEVLSESAESVTVGGETRGVATLLFSPASSEVEFVYRRGLSLDVCGALSANAGKNLLSWARRTPRCHLLRSEGLVGRVPGLHDVLSREDLGGLALFPLLGMDSVLGYSIAGLPPEPRRIPRVAAAAEKEWREAAEWIGAMREEAGRAALRALLPLHEEGLARGVKALVVVDLEDRIVFSLGISRVLPSWGRGEVMGQLLKALPGGRVLASMEPAGSGHLDWRKRKVTTGDRDHSLGLVALGVVPEWEGRGQWKTILVREGERAADEADGGILLELALRLSQGKEGPEAATEAESLAQGALAAAERIGGEESIDLSGLFRGFLHRLEPELKDDRIQLLPFLHGDLPMVRGDRRRLETALWAVLQQAWDSLLPRGGTITLRTWEEEGSVWCTIADDGEGADHGSMMEGLSLEPVSPGQEFQSLPASGVELARDLIRTGGGTFHIERRPQLWTRYTVVFSAERVVKSRSETVASGVPPAVEVRKTGNGQLDVLVVDDNDMVRTVLRKFLERKGHEVTEAMDGSMALRILEDRAFDRVMVDIDMPGTTGVEFFQQLDSVNPDMRDRTVFMTGGFQEGETEDFIQGTGRPHIQKPFDLSVISEVLQA